MADDVTVDNGGGGSGGGGNFLTRKQGPLPMWVWIAAGVGAVLIYRSITGKSSPGKAAAPSNGSNGDAQPPNIFFLPQGSGPTGDGSTIPVTVNRNPGNGGSSGVSGIFQGANPPRSTFKPVESANDQSMLDGIAGHFGVNPSDLTTLNNVSNPNLAS